MYVKMASYVYRSSEKIPSILFVKLEPNI